MARMYLLLCMLEEAEALDAYNRSQQRRQRARKTRQNFWRSDKRNEDYVGLYRLSEELINELEQDIKVYMKSPQRWRHAISVRVKILSTLSFFASGSHQKIMQRHLNISFSLPLASRCLKEVVETLFHPTIVRKYMQFPKNIEDRQALKDGFYKKFNIPGVIGCVGSTFVTLARPTENREYYYCKGGSHALCVLLYTDADLNIIHVEAGFGAATHDTHVFDSNTIKSHMEELVKRDETVHFLGEIGFDQRSYLMIPVSNATEGTPEAYYNQKHAEAYKTLETTMNTLKARFRCLLVNKVLHYHPDMVAKIIIACCLLHNMCNKAGLPAPALESTVKEQEDKFRAKQHATSRCWRLRQWDSTGWSKRNDLINTMWTSR